MTKRFRISLLAVLGGLLAILLAFGAACLHPLRSEADSEPQNVLHDTVAVHDPSIVLAYEDSAKHAHSKEEIEANGGSIAEYTKVYYVFGTQLSFAKSYDLANWTSFETNLHQAATLTAALTKEAQYSGHTTADALRENCWAPDVIWNPTMKKWCMYLTVNGATYNSSIVLLTAETLDGNWTYVGPVVFSGFGWGSNNTSLTDYAAIMGTSTVDARYEQNTQGGKDSGKMLYGMNAIDACAIFDGDRLYMTYGSWFGGIYMLELDPATGLRKKTQDGRSIYEDCITYTEGSSIQASAKYTVYTDRYMGIHIAGGHSATGEGSYIQKIGDWFYLFMSYGGYAPNGGYNMRLFRSRTITGFTDNDVSDQGNFVGYQDVGGTTAMVLNSDTSNRGEEGSTGLRMMTGYTWSWWDFSYVAQGHNSAFVDDDGRAYLVYHNKYMDGTAFHVMKVHELFVNADGWLATAPFEYTKGVDEIAKGLTAADFEGDWGYLFMTRNSGGYGNPVQEGKIAVSAQDANGKVTGSSTDTVPTNGGNKTVGFEYDPQTGAFLFRPSGNYNHRGYVIWQNLEGTNIKTLAFTVVSSDSSSFSKYTYWGYKYPDATTAGKYSASLALPDKMGPGSRLPEVADGLWGTRISYEKSGNELLVKSNGTEIERHEVAETEAVAEYSSVAVGKRLIPIDLAGVFGELSVTFGYTGYKSDWDTVLTGKNFRINLSTLEVQTGGAWQNIFESASSGGVGDHTAFHGSGTAKIVIKQDGTMEFYKNGTLQIHYAPTATFNNSSFTVKSFCELVIEEFKAGTVSVSYPMTNVTLSCENISSATEATDEIFKLANGTLTVHWAEATEAENTSTDWWEGTFGATSLPVGDNAVQLRYSRNALARGNAIQIVKKSSNTYATFYPFGPLTGTGNDWPTDWQTSGSERYYLNGTETTYSALGLKNGNVDETGGFWTGTFKLTFLRYKDTLYVVNDFVRASGSYHLIAVFTFADVTEELTVQCSGYSVGITGYVARSSGYEYVCDTHAFGAYVQTKAPTCGDEGEETRTCTVCGATEKRSVEPTGNHTGSWEQTQAPTCGVAGEESLHCTVCGKTVTKEIAATGNHTYGDWGVKTAASCEAGGEDSRTCTVCGAEEVRETATLGHNWKLQSTDRDSCDVAGTATYRCERCEETKTETLQAGEHAYESEVTKAPTCTEKGIRTYTCSQCDESYTEEIDALGHDWGEYAQTKAPTCTEKGVETRTCKRDDSHTQTRDVAALGHDWSDYVQTKAPTCKEEGEETRTCTVCGAKETRAVPVTSVHTWGEWTRVVQPGAYTEGQEERTCSVCGTKETRAVSILGNAEKFKQDVAAASAESTLEGRLAAIATALSTYSVLTDAEKESVATEYAALVSLIEAYNAEVGAVNEEYNSAVDLAIGLISSSVAAIGAIALAWFVLKRGL